LCIPTKTGNTKREEEVGKRERGRAGERGKKGEMREIRP